jgi:hypothetical protein
MGKKMQGKKKKEKGKTQNKGKGGRGGNDGKVKVAGGKRARDFLKRENRG